MKKIIFLTFLFPFANLFLSGFMHKTIQRTLSVTNTIAEYDLDGSYFDLNDKDYFDLSYQSRISSECMKHSIDEKNFNNMLSEGVKVISIVDHDWRKEVFFNSLVKQKNGIFNVSENEALCAGKTFLIEGQEKIINDFSKKINDYESVSKIGTEVYITIDPTKEAPVITQDNYSLETQKNSEGQTINILTFKKYNTVSFINLDDEGYYAWMTTNKPGDLKVMEIINIKKINNKYEFNIYEERKDKNNNSYKAKWILTYDNLKE